jgi:type I restriction enzyme S subunit
MFTSRIQAHRLRERLDAEYFTPEFVAADESIAQASRRLGCLKSLDQLRDPSAGLCYGVLQPRFVEHGVPAIEIGDLATGVLHLSELRISKEQHYEYRRSAVAGGDILISVKGTLGVTAIAPNGIEESNVNRDIARLRVGRSAIDPYYVVVFLRSSDGSRSLQRIVRGTIQRNLNIGDLLEHPVLVPDSLAQRYIGDKVRQAERLRERARRLEAAVAKTHAQYIVPPTGIDLAKRTRRLVARSLTERLDAHFYPAAVEQYLRQLEGPTRALGRLCSLVVNGQSQPEAEEGVLQATVTNLGRSFVEGSLRTVERPTDGTRALAPHDLLLCNAAHNKSYIGRDVTYSQAEGPYPSTEVMVVRVDRTQLPASFVRQYLKTEIGYLQIQSTIRGITAHSYPTDVKTIEIPIPIVPDVERDAWFATDEQMLAAGRCFDSARVLTSAATTLVEQLIDGRITEADLTAAQKGLDGGDRSADREILKALRENDALDAKPLIPDVDALYALLDEPERQDA